MFFSKRFKAIEDSIAAIRYDFTAHKNDTKQVAERALYRVQEHAEAHEINLSSVMDLIDELREEIELLRSGSKFFSAVDECREAVKAVETSKDGDKSKESSIEPMVSQDPVASVQDAPSKVIPIQPAQGV